MFCYNCHRHVDSCMTHTWREVCSKSSKKYFNLQSESGGASRFGRNFKLCTQCWSYILGPTPSAPIDYFPVMLWKFLSHLPSDSISLVLPYRTRWSYIPTEWRPWWLQSMRELDSTISLDNPLPRFYLGTHALDRVRTAIEELQWTELAYVLDHFLEVPLVRCPWGCSEYYHHAKELSFEAFLTVVSNGHFDSFYSGKTKEKQRRWVDCIRPNYPCAAYILDCDEFCSKPTLVHSKTHGIAILSCQRDDTKSTERYVFVPSSPTGSLYTSNSNQFAQAEITCRTMRATKYNTYSDTYQTAMLTGGFRGLDSCYLRTYGDYSQTDNLALIRDAYTFCLLYTSPSPRDS